MTDYVVLIFTLYIPVYGVDFSHHIFRSMAHNTVLIFCTSYSRIQCMTDNTVLGFRCWFSIPHIPMYDTRRIPLFKWFLAFLLVKSPHQLTQVNPVSYPLAPPYPLYHVSKQLAHSFQLPRLSHACTCAMYCNAYLRGYTYARFSLYAVTGTHSAYWRHIELLLF